MMRWTNRSGDSERGALVSAIAYGLLASGIVALMVGWFLLRSTGDRAQAQNSQVRSAISLTSVAVLAKMNSDFPSAWESMSESDLQRATVGLIPAEPELQAVAHLESFSPPNATTGNITAQYAGSSLIDPDVQVTAKVVYVPTTAAQFVGLDAEGRPQWLDAGAGVPPIQGWTMQDGAAQ